MNTQQRMREEQFKEQSRRRGKGYGFIYESEEKTQK